MRKILTAPATTTVCIVLNLEKMVVKEAKRAFSDLSLFGYSTDAVIVNRILPDELHDELFQKWQRIHKRYEAEVEQSFAGIPILNVPLFAREVVGLKLLARMAKATHGEQDPAQHCTTTSPQRIDKDGPGSVVSLRVPVPDRSQADWSPPHVGGAAARVPMRVSPSHAGGRPPAAAKSPSKDEALDGQPRALPPLGADAGAGAVERHPAARDGPRRRGLLPG